MDEDSAVGDTPISSVHHCQRYTNIVRPSLPESRVGFRKSDIYPDTFLQSAICMEVLSGVGFFTSPTLRTRHSFVPRPRKQSKVRTSHGFVLEASSNTKSELVEEDVRQMFLKDRQLNGDVVSRVSDMLWLMEAVKFVDTNPFERTDTQLENQADSTDDNGGFLKLSRTHEWILGNSSAPINNKVDAKALHDESEKRKKLNILKYDALKRELMLMSVGIGVACSGYCLITLSLQAAISYAVGVLFSCLYLQLLFRHADNISKKVVPQVFMRKNSKKIGIRTEDLQNFLERSVMGSGISLSSPRLVIPASIYGLWMLSHRYIASDFFDFQIVPAMVGMFVYKAAALVQVYRDNDDLQLIFPENELESSE